MLATVMGLGSSVFALVAAWNVWNTHSDEATLFWRIISVVLLLLVFGGFGFYGIVGSSRDRVVLSADRITVYQMLNGRRSLRRDEIKGRRRIQRRYDYYTMLVPNRPGLDVLKIDAGYATDAVFDAWLASIPDLDATNS